MTLSVATPGYKFLMTVGRIIVV